MPRLAAVRRIDIRVPDRELVFCSTFNHSFTSLGKGSASSLRLRPASAKASLQPLFNLLCHDNLHRYKPPRQQQRTQISQNCSGHFALLKQGTGCTRALHSLGHRCLCANMPGHAPIGRACLGRRARHNSLAFTPSFSLTAYFQPASENKRQQTTL